MIRRLLPLTYAWMVGQGLLAVFLPRQAIKLNSRLLLSGYENPGDLEPRDWYVRATRIAGLGMLVTGVTGLLAGELADEPEEPEPEAETEDEDSESEVMSISIDEE